MSGGGNPSLMKSSDLKDWLFLGPLLHDDLPATPGIPEGEDISCPHYVQDRQRMDAALYQPSSRPGWPSPVAKVALY